MEKNLKQNLSNKQKLKKIKPFLSFIQCEKYTYKRILKKYGAKNYYQNYNNLILDNLLYNRNSHLVSVFKDYMIWDYIDEFLKRFYNSKETFERIPKFSTFYKNYLEFFCKPIIKNFYLNLIVQENSEKKAELYYNQNLRGKKDNNIFEENIFLNEINHINEKETKIEKTIFNSIIRKKIDEISFYDNTIKETITLNETYLNDNNNNNNNINKNNIFVNYSLLTNSN